MPKKGTGVNCKDIVSGAAAGLITTVILLAIAAFLISTEKMKAEVGWPIMLSVSLLSGIVCGRKTKKNSKEGRSISAVLSGILYSLVCIITAILAAEKTVNAENLIGACAIMTAASWVSYKIDLFKSNKKFHKKSKRKKFNN